MKLRVKKRTGQATEVTIGDAALLFSYETCVGASFPPPVGNVKRENLWGVTTGRHQSEFVADHGGEWAECLEGESFRLLVLDQTGMEVR